MPIAFLSLGLPRPRAAQAKAKGCPAGMVSVKGKLCIDRYEASTVELLAGGKTRKHSPFKPVGGLRVKAVSKKGRIPQAHISRDQAAEACENAGKRLCTDEEWITTCKGKRPTLYPYGDDYKGGYCNDKGFSSFNHYHGPAGGGEAPKEAYTWENMNDTRLNQMAGTLSPTGAFKKCRSGFQVYDLVGNLHEWTAAPAGTFRGGYYLDAHKHGDGCDYKTTAHSPNYYDYSLGFRCCK